MVCTGTMYKADLVVVQTLSMLSLSLSLVEERKFPKAVADDDDDDDDDVRIGFTGCADVHATTKQLD